MTRVLELNPFFMGGSIIPSDQRELIIKKLDPMLLAKKCPSTAIL
jgi:hypothetical protein